MADIERLSPVTDPDSQYGWGLRPLPRNGSVLQFVCETYSVAVGVDVDVETGEEIGIRIVYNDHETGTYWKSDTFDETFAIALAELVACLHPKFEESGSELGWHRE